MRHKQAYFVLLLYGAAGLSGCTDPRAVAPTRIRMDSIRNHLVTFRDREEDGYRRLAVMSDWIERDARAHDEDLARDVRRLDEWVQGDLQRRHGDQPKYRSALQDAFDGDLTRAEDTAYRMIY